MKLGVTLRQSRVRTVQTERKGTHTGTRRRKMCRKWQNTNINTNSPQLHHSKAAGNGGFLCISNGFHVFVSLYDSS